ncbi:hypothetical protein P0G10_00110 [Eubacteriales bacterium DFI.9.88]|nr:hypothetical protein [Eubacteriales bacterium DFI.9.88]
MAEKNKDERTTARSAVENALVKALSDDMGEIPEVSITVEELKALDAADKKKRRKRAARCASVAAVAVIVCAAVVYMAWPETVVPVDADKNTEQRVETGDGEIVINEGEIQGDSGITEYNESNWEKVSGYRIYVPKLVIPGYIPKKYIFQNLFIEIYGDSDFLAEYTYSSDHKSLIITQRTYSGGSNVNITKGITKKITTNWGDIYTIEDNGAEKIYMKYSSDGYLSVAGDITTEKAAKILYKVKLP